MVHGSGYDIDTGLPMSLSMNVYAKYQWQTTAHRTKTSGTVMVSK
ncbi:outer membrane protein OmpK [Shigella sonnei]